MEPDILAAFAAAVEKLKKRPVLIHKAELGSFKDYLLSWGVELPAPGPPPAKPPVQIDLSDSDDEAARRGAGEAPAAGGNAEAAPADGQHAANGGAEKPKAPAEAVAIADSDEEDDDRLPEDAAPFPPLPAALSVEEPDEEQQAACAAARQAASDALEAGNTALAVDKYTEAIMTGCASALLYARRGELLMKQRRPNAAISDCSAALQVNPDCGKAYRIRGVAHRRLGRWEEAHRDLALGQKLDYDESTVAVQKLVAEKVRRLEERRAQQAQALEEAQKRLSAPSAPAPKRRRNR